MRIVFVTPYPAFPPHGGGVQRMYQMLRYLHKDHQIWCLSLSPSPQATEAAQPLAQFAKLQFFPAPQRSLQQRAWTTLTSPLPDMALRGAPSLALSQALESLLRSESIDVVQACSIEMGQYALQAQQPTLITALDQWNAEYVLQKRAALTDLRQLRQLHGGVYSLIQWFKLVRHERMLGHKLDLMTVVSAEDAQALQKIGIQQALPVIPNGVDTDYFTPENRAPQADTLVFTGSLDFRPNIDALRWFVQQVLPLIHQQRPQVRLQVVGRNPSPKVQELASTHVEIVGAVPDIRPYLDHSQAFILPMRIGGGVRLKLLEAFAAGIPLISTTMGADGVEGLYPNTHCLLADDPRSFANATLNLLQNPELTQNLSTAARQLVLERYDWSVIVPKLEQAWQARLALKRSQTIAFKN